MDSLDNVNVDHHLRGEQNTWDSEAISLSLHDQPTRQLAHKSLLANRVICCEELSKVKTR